VENLPERTDLGYLLARASQRWDALLAERCRAHGFPEVRPSFGSILLPLFDDDGLRIGDLTDRARIAKQSMTTLVRDAVAAGLVTREVDPEDGRSHRIWLTPRAMEFRAVADLILNEMTDRLIAVVDPESVEIVSRSLAAVKSLPLENNS
jgi:DNA-binding MarR family transcriptional regulator